MLTRTAIAEATLTEEELRDYAAWPLKYRPTYTPTIPQTTTLYSPAACHAFPYPCGPW